MSGHRGECYPGYRCYTVVYIVDHNRYLAVVCTEGCQDTEESVILGIDVIDDKSSVGLVLSIWGDSKIILDGDG